MVDTKSNFLKSQLRHSYISSIIILYTLTISLITSTTSTILTTPLQNSISGSKQSINRVPRTLPFSIPHSIKPSPRSSDFRNVNPKVIDSPGSVDSRSRFGSFESQELEKRKTVDKIVQNRVAKGHTGLVQSELEEEGKFEKNGGKSKSQSGKIVAERYVVSFRQFISKSEFLNHIERVKQLIREEIMKGIKSIDGEIPRITKIMMFDPTERLPEGFHTYIALLTNTIIEKISAVSGIHILKDFNIKLSLGSLDPTVSDQPNISPLVHAISKRSPNLSDDFDPKQAYVGLSRQRVATESRLGNWGLDRIDQPSFKRDGWYHYHPSGGEGVRVVVMDSGITPHRDFEDRLLPSRSFIQDNNIQDDSITSGHGTFVASFIGSSKTGVAKKANLQSYTIVDGFEAKYSRILLAMYVLSDDVVTSRKRKKEKIVVNMSFGFPKATATAFDLKRGMYEIESLAVRMVEVGAILVKSAGNSGADECDMVLNRVPEIIHVGAINMDDQRWEGSNYGDCVDIYAPGDRVLGFDPGLNVYHHGSGTSFAAPHVSGVIALYLSSGFFDEVPKGKLAAIVKEQLIKNAWILRTRIDSFQGTLPRVVNAIPKFLYQRL